MTLFRMIKPDDMFMSCINILLWLSKEMGLILLLHKLPLEVANAGI